MRTAKSHGGLTVQAIAGTYVVVLSFDLAEADCAGLMGFSIHRQDHVENESYYMKGNKAFAATDPGFPAGSQYSTKDHPWQSFQWADYSAKPDYRYTYTITALKGDPEHLVPLAEVQLDVTTEAVTGQKHNVYFNRGTAASQEYVRRFGDRSPDEVPNKQAFVWLSRGIYEALEDYLKTCEPGKHALRIAAYEFHYAPFLDLIKKTIDRGVDIRIIYDARQATGPKNTNREAVDAAGLKAYCRERTEGASYISHNKFIVKLENGCPASVWTGGMNFSENGIFGHSNVAHVIADATVAQSFMSYWDLLFQNLKNAPMKKAVEKLAPLPALPLANGECCVFSPRKSLAALDLYHELAMKAAEGFFMTFAFGLNDTFKDVYRNSGCGVRYALLEKKTRAMAKDDPQRAIEEQAIQDLRNMPENIFAVGDFIKTNAFDGWVKERLSGLSKNVKYIHNKFMLVDPLGNDPMVITGSANFSDASTDKNDENMVLIKGNTRVADIYFGEFMRLFSHHSFRESLAWRKPNDPPKPLKTGDWWKDYFGNTQRAKSRLIFK